MKFRKKLNTDLLRRVENMVTSVPVPGWMAVGSPTYSSHLRKVQSLLFVWEED
jgi:hypothetical protein